MKKTELRSEAVNIRLTKSERVSFLNEAAHHGMALSEWLRILGIDAVEYRKASKRRSK